MSVGSHGASSSFVPPRPALMQRQRKVAPDDQHCGGVVLDAYDAGIEDAIKRLENKSFIKDGLIPEIQCLLSLPPNEAKQAYLAALTQYALVMMLVLASLLGTALNPLQFEHFPDSPQSLIEAYNMLATIICCASLFGTCTFLLESTIVEGTPVHKMHSILARADSLFDFGTNMMAVGIQGTFPLLMMRAWISRGNSLRLTQCIVLTAICSCLYFRMTHVYFRHLQANWPQTAQRWTKMFAPFLYKKQMSHAAIDDLVQELRYLQQPRDKTLTSVQLGGCLEKYFETLRDGHGPNPVLLADQSAFLQMLEAEAGGRLALTMERLAKKTFERAVDAALEKLADEAIDLVRGAVVDSQAT